MSRETRAATSSRDRWRSPSRTAPVSATGRRHWTGSTRSTPATDRDREAGARTPGYVAHAPESIEAAALDGDAWVTFLDGFLEGFPDPRLEVLDTSAEERMVAQRILFTGTQRIAASPVRKLAGRLRRTAPA